MSHDTDGQISEMGGSEALPRKNGELVFEMPWESRAFGLAVSLSDAGVVEWPEFREALVAAIEVTEEEPEVDTSDLEVSDESEVKAESPDPDLISESV